MKPKFDTWFAEEKNTKLYLEKLESKKVLSKL